MVKYLVSVISIHLPIPVDAQLKAWVCGRSLAGIAVSNPAGAIIYVMTVVCCQVEVSTRS